MPPIRFLLIVVALFGPFTFARDALSSPDTTALKCYRAKDPIDIRGQGPGWLHLESGVLGQDQCRIVGGFRLICVASSKDLVGPIETRTGSTWTPTTPVTLPSEEELTQDRLCYKIRCATNPTFNGDTSFTDAFGTRKLIRYRPYLYCGPAEASLCGDGNIDFGEDCDDGNRVNGDCCSATCHAEPTTQSCGPDTDGNACTAPRCGPAGTCVQTGFLQPTTAACPDSDSNVCTTPRCDGAGACVQDAILEANTTACGDTDGNECTSARCDGTGGCDQSGFMQPSTTHCTETDGNPCTTALCNGLGSCSQTGFTSPDGTPCPDSDANVCTHAFCESGTCDQSIHATIGTSCPDIDGDACNLSGCDENGTCAQDFFVRNCNLPEICDPFTGTCQ